jgi:hypothetical protein
MVPNILNIDVANLRQKMRGQHPDSVHLLKDRHRFGLFLASAREQACDKKMDLDGNLTNDVLDQKEYSLRVPLTQCPNETSKLSVGSEQSLVS